MRLGSARLGLSRTTASGHWLSAITKVAAATAFKSAGSRAQSIFPKVYALHQTRWFPHQRRSQVIPIHPSVREPWNKGKLVGQKTPLKLEEIWAIRIRLQIARRCRELAMFNLVIDNKLRACDLIQLRVRDVCHGQSMASRALVLQQKTGRPVQFEITEPAYGINCLDRSIQTQAGELPVSQPRT